MRKISDAQDYLIGKVLQPAIDSADAPKKSKDVALSTRTWVRQFKRIGDLIRYIERFNKNVENEDLAGLKTAGLPSFEDIRLEFLTEFEAYRDDKTRLDDFVIGNDYTGFEINIFAQRYNLQSGGILPIGNANDYSAVFVKATLSGGSYPNSWIIPDLVLKYYLKANKNRFDEERVENAAIIKHPNVPVYAFVRHNENGPFTFKGSFYNHNVNTEADGSKWFEFRRKDFDTESILVTSTIWNEEFSKKVEASRNSSKESRRNRLKAASRTPKTRSVTTVVYIRNPDVVAEVLDRANGKCEACGAQSPFSRRSNSTPYLEVHHKIPLAFGGEDSVENAIAACPNCHRQEHYGPARWPFGDDELPEQVE